MYTLKKLRNRAGITQGELGKLIGVAPMYVSLIENNHRPLTASVASEVVEAVTKIDSSIKVGYEELMADHESSFMPSNVRSEMRIFLLHFFRSKRELTEALVKHDIDFKMFQRV